MMKVDGVTRVNKSNGKAEIFYNVNIYAGDNWYSAFEAKMKNLLVKTKA